MTALLAALWMLVGTAVTVLPMDSLPDGWTNEYGQMVLQDGRVLNAALGCHGADDIRYYRRSEGMHRADIKREDPWMPFGERIQRAHERHVETEYHELGHGLHCSISGDLAVELTDAQGRQAFRDLGLDPDLFQRRPSTYRAAYTALTTLDPSTWGSVTYCYSNVAEWFACLATASAKHQALVKGGQ